MNNNRFIFILLASFLYGMATNIGWALVAFTCMWFYIWVFFDEAS